GEHHQSHDARFRQRKIIAPFGWNRGLGGGGGHGGYGHSQAWKGAPRSRHAPTPFSVVARRRVQCAPAVEASPMALWCVWCSSITGSVSNWWNGGGLDSVHSS